MNIEAFATNRSDAGRPRPRVRQVYPPPWYLDLVRRHLRAATGECGASLAEALTATAERRARGQPAGEAGSENATLLALAHELVGSAALDDLPHRSRQFVLGLEVEQVRGYLRGVAREIWDRVRQ